MPATQTQNSAHDASDIFQLFEPLSILERLVEGQVQHAHILSKQEEHLSALQKQKDLQLILDPKYIEFQDSRQRKREIERQWHDEILMWDPLQDWPPDEDRSLYDILSPVSVEQEQLWTTWQYQAAYPNTADFLAKATSKPPRIQRIPKDVLTSVKNSRSRVSYYSFLQTGKKMVVETWSSEDPVAEEPGKKVPMPQRMWNIVQRRVVVDRTGKSGRVGKRLPSRLLCIEDISPVVAAILLASTPKTVVSNVSPFLERYLGFTNFGKASMQSIKSETVNTFIFEYHFAFYYVTKESLETHLVLTDVRKLRKFSWFGQRPESDTCSRHIYEEQMSFILIGHGQDTYTCYQLGEKYFNGPKSGEFRTFVKSLTWTPSTMFLSWIAMALHHVGIRWQDAIAAVDAQIASEEAVVFHQINNFDLASGAKDLKISKLRTYFWALEAYKLFEETLEATVSAWEQFKRHSLDKVNDGRKPEDYSKSVELIELAIARLQDKIERIRRKSEQVLRLRDGLFSVTSLSDTSVTINQGENIRLLTYFTILFLPLSFSTSIFGMQSILPPTTSMKTFTIVLPVVTVSTILAILLLTVSLQDVQQAIRKTIPNPRQKLYYFYINSHPRKQWGNGASRDLGEPPTWKYLLFLTELCLVSIPVHEVKAAANLYGLCKRRAASESDNNLGSTISQTHLRSTTTLVSEGRPDTGDGNATANAKSRVRQVREQQLEIQQTQQAEQTSILAAVRRASTVLLTGIRILLLSLWIPLLLLEYTVLLFCCPFLGGLIDPMQLELDTRLQPSVNRREQLTRCFIAPLLFLGFDLDLSRFPFSSRGWRWRSPFRRTKHEHRSPRPPPPPPTGPYGHALTPLPPPSSSYHHPGLHLHQTANGPPGRAPHVRSASRIRQMMAQQNFQAASAYPYPQQEQHLHLSGPSQQHNAHGYLNNSNPQGSIPRHAGGA